MNPYLEGLFNRHLSHVLAQEPVPDNAEEMNWRLFLAHSQDMQGFAADIFIGGPSERRHPADPGFVGLRERWPNDSVSLIADLAAVWADGNRQKRLLEITEPMRSGGTVAEGISSAARERHPRSDHLRRDIGVLFGPDDLAQDEQDDPSIRSELGAAPVA